MKKEPYKIDTVPVACKKAYEAGQKSLHECAVELAMNGWNLGIVSEEETVKLFDIFDMMEVK